MTTKKQTEFKYLKGLTTKKGYHRQYVDKVTGIVKEIFTGRKHGMPTNEVEVMFYHPEDKNTHSDFMTALESAIDLGLSE